MKERWFVSDPDGDGVTMFEMEADATAEFRRAIQACVDCMDKICMGRITAFADPDVPGYVTLVESKP